MYFEYTFVNSIIFCQHSFIYCPKHSEYFYWSIRQSTINQKLAAIAAKTVVVVAVAAATVAVAAAMATVTMVAAMQQPWQQRW